MKNLQKIFLLLFIISSAVIGQESRGIWVVRDVLTNNSISHIIEDVKKLQCNKLFLQLRALGGVYYPTQYNIPANIVNPDKLQELFNAAKLNNIEIHIWLNFCYVQSAQTNFFAENHVLAKSTDAIVFSPENRVESEGYFLHPNDKTNLSEVKNIIMELVNNYEFKGIHLDYFRYPKDVDHYSNTGRTNYILQTGLDPIIPINNPEKFIAERGMGSYTFFKESYSDFLRNELTQTLRDIRNFCKTMKIDLQLSVAVKPNPLKAKHQFYQDWVKWLEEDLCDFVVLMNYNPEPHIFEENCEITLKRTNPAKIMVGIGAYNINLWELKSRINYVQNSEFNGYTLFSYNYIISNKGIFNQLLEWNSN